MPQAFFVPRHETLLVSFPLTVKKLCAGVSKYIDIPKTRFLIRDERRTSIMCKTSPTNTPENVTAHSRQGRPVLDLCKSHRSSQRFTFSDFILIKDKDASGATYEDAVTLARYDCKHEPNTVGYHHFIDECMRTHQGDRHGHRSSPTGDEDRRLVYQGNTRYRLNRQKRSACRPHDARARIGTARK